jgi:hypothetical protein
LRFLITFFWPIATDSQPAVSLISRHFLGQLIAIWALVGLESGRHGNRDRACSHILLIGLTVQTLTASIGIPLFCTLHLATSIIAKPSVSKEQISSSAHHAAAIPWAVTIGLILPSVMMTSPTSAIQKQFWIVMFQIFPALVQLAQSIISSILRSSTPTMNKEQSEVMYLSGATKSVYRFAIGVSALTHIGTISISIAAQFSKNVSTRLYADQRWSSAEFLEV